MQVDLAKRLESLAGCQDPWLIGVRHHSAILSAKLPQLLEQFAPERVCIELPSDVESWLPWIAHPDTTAPVALAASSDQGQLFFYPLADFSPELAAIRWAIQKNVPIRLIDLPLGFPRQTDLVDSPEPRISANDQSPSAVDPVPLDWRNQLQRKLGTNDSEELWERLVESPGVDDSAESVRRAGLLFGATVRDGTSTISDRDRLREAWMRRCLSETDQRTVAIVGSFHALALLPDYNDDPFDQLVKGRDSDGQEIEDEKPAKKKEPWKTALIPYSFGQLDSRSGYPAGVLDPVWHQAIWESGSNEERDQITEKFLIEICRSLRKNKVNASTADAIAALSMTRGLSRLRNLATLGRLEMHQAIISTLVQGEQIARRKAVATATRHVLVGHRMGQLPQDSPRSGLVSHIEKLFAELKLPGPESATDKPKRIRLDSLRNPLARARAVTFERLHVLGIPYAKRLDESLGARQNLTEHWELDWQHGTTARLYTLTTKGINLQQVAAATIQGWHRPEAASKPTPAIALQQLVAAAKCGLGAEVIAAAKQINEIYADSANLPQVVTAAHWYQQICRGLVPGLPIQNDDETSTANPPHVLMFDAKQLQDRSHLLATAIARLQGVTGSENVEDGRAILELTSWIESGLERWPSDGGLRFRQWLQHATETGSPLMQGLTVGCQMQLQMLQPPQVNAIAVGWWDQASHPTGRKQLEGRLTGWLFAVGARLLSDLQWLESLSQQIEQSTDQQFLHRLLPLNRAFQTLSKSQRNHLLNLKTQNVGPATMVVPSDPLKLAANRQLDEQARQAIARILPALEIRKLDPSSLQQIEKTVPIKNTVRSDQELTVVDRWHLVLGGVPKSKKGIQVRGGFAELLDGQGSGLGDDDLVDFKDRSGGDEAPQVDAREWAKQLDKLLGSEVAQEVLIEAAAKGRLAVFKVINPNRTPPSADLLKQILSMHSHADGSLLQHLRQIAKNISDRLARLLAIRLRTHLTGLMTMRPRSRPSPLFDLPRTLQRNLQHSYRDAQQKTRIVAAQPVFRSPATRNMDWSIHLVVDVSGSMETSTVYAALVAAVFAKLPAVDLQFVTFSTEVADLSEHADDPLSLLTEVRIGGGTHIALGLRAARAAIRVPQRSIVVLITDFHEGVSVPELLGEVRTMATSGVKLLGLAALDDEADCVYHTGVAGQCVAAGMPVAALSPEQLADWVAKKIRGGG